MMKAAYLAIVLTFIGTPILRQVVGDPQRNTFADVLPAGANLAVEDSVHGKIYVATDKAIESLPGGRKYDYDTTPDIPEYFLPSPDGRELIFRSLNQSYLLNADNMSLIRRIEFGDAWWERGKLAYFDADNEDIRLPGLKKPVKLKGIELISVDESGKYFLAMREIARGTEQNGNVPTFRFFLCRRDGVRVRIVRRLVTMLYDPGSQGGARHLAVIGTQTALFGIHEGAALISDYVGVLRKGHVTGPIKDKQGHYLQFAQPPIVIGGAIVAIADAVNTQYVPVERYLVTLSSEKLRVKAIGKQAMFVTYDPLNKRVGLGISANGAVQLTWKSEREFLMSNNQ
jgi:hypothetical protein